MKIDLATTIRGAVVGIGLFAFLTHSTQRSEANAPRPSFCQGATFTPDANDSKCKRNSGFLPCVSGTPMYPGGNGFAYDLDNPRPCGVRRCGIIFAVRCGKQTGTIECFAY